MVTNKAKIHSGAMYLLQIQEQKDMMGSKRRGKGVETLFWNEAEHYIKFQQFRCSHASYISVEM